VKVRVVDGGSDLNAFIDLPYRLHANDPLWVPPLRMDIRARLSRQKNPFFDHAEATYFLAERHGEVVGRIAAIANRRHDRTYDDGVAFFGFFECVDDREVAAALLEAASNWARERGYSRLRGPTSFSTNDECGLLVDGFDTPPTLMMPHNPAYYVRLVEDCGFEKSKDLWAFRGDGTTAPVPARAQRAAELIQKRLGLTIRGLDRKRFSVEVERIKDAYNQAWQRNWGFVSMSGREIDHMAAQFKPVYIPDLVPFVEIDGKIVGFGLAIPDLNGILLPNRSGRLFPTVLRLLWAVRRRKISRMRVLLLGILPEYQGRGIDAVLWHWLWTRGLANGINWAEASWILEDNAPMCNAAERMGFEHYKTYRLYERPIDAGTGSS
jgi:GNAT superfamily N-acetyltransferase